MAETAATATIRELDRAKAQMKAGLLMALESAWGQASYVARQLSLFGEPSSRAARLAETKRHINQTLGRFAVRS